MIASYSLDGEWILLGFPEGSYSVDLPGMLGDLPVDTIPGQVPGNVELDLMRAGVIDYDPYVGDNVLRLSEYERREWWYRRSFDGPIDTGKRVTLRFDGLDCIADVWLNAVHLGRRENMLIPQEFDVTDIVSRGGENDLVVRLGSPIARAADYEYPDSVDAMHVNTEQLYVRKAPHMYGWDIMPRVVSAGIWRSVTLGVHGEYEITDAHYRAYDVSDAHAGLHLRWKIDAPMADWSRLRLRMSGECGDSRFETTVPVAFAAGNINVHLDAPKLWWPRGYGDANLYDVTLELLLDGECVDQRTDQIGLREVTLERTDITDTTCPGEFVFRVNGERILAKGTNWVPADAFHSRDRDRIPEIMEFVADSACNMIRCWGGNVYEDDVFYDTCDRLGVLVWQDFAMACARYPQDDDFAMRLTEEVEAVVRRLRNHPCIALWAGDNECDYNHFSVGMDPNANRSTRKTIPAVLHRLDPWRPYLPCSPYFAPEMVKRGDMNCAPEQHLWGPRDYYKSRFYTESRYHFVSEIGYHGCPNRTSLERFLSPGALWPWHESDGRTPNREWRVHAADTTESSGPYAYRIELMAKQVRELFGAVPDNLDDFILASQISQAEAKKFFIEMTRLGKWRRTGVLWWNLMDGWPQFSDAVIDWYYGVKLVYYFIRRVQQPVCVMIGEPDNWQSRVVVGNDSRERACGTYRVIDCDGGDTLLSGAFDVEPNKNAEVGCIPVSRGEQRMFLLEWDLREPVSGMINGGNHYLLGTPPFSLDRYRTWLTTVAALPYGFDVLSVGR